MVSVTIDIGVRVETLFLDVKILLTSIKFNYIINNE
jgi:hypothetical protein